MTLPSGFWEFPEEIIAPTGADDPLEPPLYATQYQDPQYRGVNVPPGQMPTAPDTPIGAVRQLIDDPSLGSYYLPTPWDIERGVGFRETIARREPHAVSGVARVRTRLGRVS